MLVGPKNVFKPHLNPQNSPKGPKKVQNIQNETELKIKRKVCTSQQKKVIVYISRSQKLAKPDPDPKNSPNRVQKRKKGPKWVRIKNKKIGLYFQNLS